MEDLQTSALREEEFSKKIDLKLWKRLLRYALRYRWLFVGVIFLMLVVAFVDILYPQLTRYAIDNIVAEGEAGLRKLLPFGLVYLGFVLFQGAGVVSFILFCGKLEVKIAYDIRQDAFKKLQQLSFSYYDKTAVGYIMARMVGDIPRLSEMIAWSLTDIFWSSGYIIGCIIFLLAMNWKLGLVTLTVLPPLAVISVYFQRRILRQHRIVRKQNSRITSAFNEGIMGAVTTKTLVREEKNFEEFKAEAGTMKKASIRAAVLSAMFTPIVMTLGSIATAIALYAGGRTVIAPTIFGTTMTIGVLSSFISYSTNLFDPMQQLAGIFAELQSAQASAERVISLLDTPCDITDSDEVIEKYGDCFDPKRENWEEIEGGVEFRDVSFSYKEGEKVLDHFDLTVRPGEKIALVGETGAGKSTIVNLVCRFYEPTGGAILIDGIDYRERSQLWLQDRLGYVLQSPHLFSGSIRDNIRYGRKDATDEEVVRAAQMVHADSFIESLEKGYDTEVGEGGARLSTGQKQLISFARVILADPRIFVLDEATSSIDTETEALIQNAIGTVLQNRTSFIVAHRLSTIRSCDRILVIRGGKITESGTHRELLKLRGYYYDLYTTQFTENSTRDVLN
ncbi:MAG: ABC transporter ATP-binding protein [Clostridia bacterium]|nr:ABC transporter ATP-binding protein [Clostridia bacterium]MBQ5488776.1 ABC transporter ATP-binding protein [Clostridia bacterium]